jgi:hypothetical protein
MLAYPSHMPETNVLIFSLFCRYFLQEFINGTCPQK